MPRSTGLRDDDHLGRLAEIETRLDALEAGRDAPTGRTTDAARVPERDERRDAEARNRQVMVQVPDRESDQIPGMPDHMAGGHEEDNVRVVMAEDREKAERRAAKADEKPSREDEVKDARSSGQETAAADPRQVAPPEGDKENEHPDRKDIKAKAK